MSIFEPASSQWSSRMLSVLRIVAGLIFFTGGTLKLFGFPPMPTSIPPLPMPPMWEIQVSAILETFGGPLIALGLFTRPLSFILAGEMAVAYFQFSFPVSFWPTTNYGIPAVLYCFIFLYFVFAGGGEWSVDRMIANSRRRQRPA